jgi:hypothetical protein
MNSGREEEARMLAAMLEVHEKALEQAIATVRREEPIVTSLRRAIAALMEESPYAQARITNGTNQASFHIIPDGAHRAAAIHALQQNESGIPTRKAEYADRTIIEAMHKAFVKIAPTGFIHIDRIVDEVYNPIEHRDVFYRIKRTLVSEIIRGMKKGLFVRGRAPNTFGLAAATVATASH